MEKQFNINLHYNNLATELFEWYQLQGFAILNRIHETNLFDYPKNEIEYMLDELRDEWNELPIAERMEFYNQYKNFKF